MTDLEYMICIAESVGEIDLETRDKLLNVYTESFLSTPVKGFLKKLKIIKDTKPKEYDGPEVVKKFVDKNYDDIIKVSNLLEKEPDKMRKDDIGFISSFCLTLVGGMVLMCTTAPTAGVVGMIMYIGSLISSIVWSIIRYIRVSKDTKASDDLSKIRSSLKRINLSKLDKNTKNKISDIIEAIDDAETELSARLKVSKESVDVDDIRKEIYERELTGEITVEEREELLDYLDSQLIED